MPTSIDTDGSVYNGTGYITGKRLSSSGGLKDKVNGVVTGYIPVDNDDVIRIFGCGWATNQHASNYIGLYKADFSTIGTFATVSNGYNLSNYNSSVITVSDGYYTYDANGDAMFNLSAMNGIGDVAYIRVGSVGLDGSGFGNPTSMIVTVNEEIT